MLGSSVVLPSDLPRPLTTLSISMDTWSERDAGLGYIEGDIFLCEFFVVGFFFFFA